MREVIIPHESKRGPLRAVRRMLVHSSIAEIQQVGLYDAYRAAISDEKLARITELIGPGWMSVDLALAHYDACNRLELSDEQIRAAGSRAGEKMGSALLVAGTQSGSPASDRSAWDLIGAFSRMGRRLQEGGSAQYVKLGPNTLQIEHLGNPLFSPRYYGVAHGAFLRQAFASLGIEVSEVQLSGYRADKAQIEVTLSWR